MLTAASPEALALSRLVIVLPGPHHRHFRRDRPGRVTADADRARPRCGTPSLRPRWPPGHGPAYTRVRISPAPSRPPPPRPHRTHPHATPAFTIRNRSLQDRPHDHHTPKATHSPRDGCAVTSAVTTPLAAATITEIRSPPCATSTPPPSHATIVLPHDDSSLSTPVTILITAITQFLSAPTSTAPFRAHDHAE